MFLQFPVDPRILFDEERYDRSKTSYAPLEVTPKASESDFDYRSLLSEETRRRLDALH